MIKQYTTESGSTYLVDGNRVCKVGDGQGWRACVDIIADGRLVFTESVVEGADPPVLVTTISSRIVGVSYVDQE